MGYLVSPIDFRWRRHRCKRLGLFNHVLNAWLEDAGDVTRYLFNMLSPKSYNVFYQKLRDGELAGFRSELDVEMGKAAKAER